MGHDITTDDANVFDGLLTEVFAECLDHERRMADYWTGRLEAARNEDRKKEAQERLDAAMEHMRERLHGEVRWLASSMVKCDDPGCGLHRALFVGMA